MCSDKLADRYPPSSVSRQQNLPACRQNKQFTWPSWNWKSILVYSQNRAPQKQADNSAATAKQTFNFRFGPFFPCKPAKAERIIELCPRAAVFSTLDGCRHEWIVNKIKLFPRTPEVGCCTKLPTNPNPLYPWGSLQMKTNEASSVLAGGKTGDGKEEWKWDFPLALFSQETIPCFFWAGRIEKGEENWKEIATASASCWPFFMGMLRDHSRSGPANAVQ